jgi:hypothetical protein
VGELVPVLVAIVTTVGTVLAAYLAARSGKLGRIGPGADEVAGLRTRLEVEGAKAGLLTEQLIVERANHASTRAELEECRAAKDFAERASDACERRLNAVYAELRRSGRLDDRRHEAGRAEGPQQRRGDEE